MNKILEQDEAAPDSFEYFECRFLKTTGSNVTEFQANARRTDADGGCYTEWVQDKFILNISADYPLYSLYEDRNLITHVTQTQSLNCVSACLAMLTGRDVNDITDDFHDDYHACKRDVRDYLNDHNIPYERLLAEQREPEADKIYIAAVASLNLEGALHQIIIETTTDGKGWWVYDPNECREDKKFYTATMLKAYILEYAIPRSWVRGGRQI